MGSEPNHGAFAPMTGRFSTTGAHAVRRRRTSLLPVRLKKLVRVIFDKLEKRESEIVEISALSRASFST